MGAELAYGSDHGESNWKIPIVEENLSSSLEAHVSFGMTDRGSNTLELHCSGPREDWWRPVLRQQCGQGGEEEEVDLSNVTEVKFMGLDNQLNAEDDESEKI